MILFILNTFELELELRSFTATMFQQKQQQLKWVKYGSIAISLTPSAQITARLPAQSCLSTTDKDDDRQGQLWDPQKWTDDEKTFKFHYIFILLMSLLKGITSLNNDAPSYVKCGFFYFFIFLFYYLCSCSQEHSSSPSHTTASTRVQNNFNFDHYKKRCGWLLLSR